VQYYSITASAPYIYIVLGPDRTGETFRIDKCRCGIFVDPAASIREGPGDKQIWRRMPSWTVIGTFLLLGNRHLVWFRNKRIQAEVPDVIKAIKQEYVAMRKEYNILPEFVGIEDSGLGIGVYQQCRQDGLPTRPLKPRSLDKLVRATPAANRMKNGLVWFPQTAPWKEALESEIFSWTGHPQETSDQIDVLGYAGMWVDEEAANRNEKDTPSHHH